MHAERSAPGSNCRRSALTVCGLILGLTVVAYLPALSGGFIWDDDGYLLDNFTLLSLDGLQKIWFQPGATQDYYPLTFSTFWLEYRLWRLAPFGYHLTNVLLHAANACLLWWLLARLRVPGAAVAAAIFAVHPVHVESVAWITERKNVLSGLFYLLSVHAFLSFQGPAAGQGKEEASAWRGRRWYLLSLACFALAMLSKTVVVTLPLILLVLTWWQRGRLTVRDFLCAIPYLLIAVPLFVLAFSSSANFGGAGVKIVGSADSGSAAWDFTLLERFLVAGRVMWFYAWKLVWPTQLTFVYPRWQVDSRLWWQPALAISAAAVPLVLWATRRWIGRGPLVAVLFFGLSLAPASGFFNFYFQRYSLVADHLQYVASVGLIALAVATACRLLRVNGTPYGATRGALFAVPPLCLLAVLTWQQCRSYRDLETLWRDTLAKNPSSKMAHTNLGVILLDRNQLEEAFDHFQAALRIDPNFEVAYHNLAIYWQRKGDDAQAIAYLQRTLEHDPRYVLAYDTWGRLLLRQGRRREALEKFREALRIDQEFVPSLFNLASILHQQGRLDVAEKLYGRCLRINPYFVEANFNLGTLLSEQDRYREAIPILENVLVTDPGHAAAHFNLGVIRLEYGEPESAVGHFQATLQREPNDALAHHYLGLTLEQLGRSAEAMRCFQRAAQLQPASHAPEP